MANVSRKELAEIRRAFADYLQSEGCGCCQGHDHTKHLEQIARLLGVPKYSDGSGYNFTTFRTEAKRRSK